jgi:hypothetical protein
MSIFNKSIVLLPDEIILKEILNHTNIDSSINIYKTNKRYYEYCSNDLFWDKLYHKYYDDSQMYDTTKSYYETFKLCYRLDYLIKKLDLNYSIYNLYIMEIKVEALFKMVLEDDEFEIPQFVIFEEDDVYDGPKLGLYGGIEDDEERNNFKVEYYDKYDNRFDTSSILQFFPCREEFKSKITTLSKSFCIDHHVTFTLNKDDNECQIKYKIFNGQRFWYDGCEDKIIMHMKMSKDELKNILINVFTMYPKIIVCDVDSASNFS